MFKKFFRKVRETVKKIAPIAAPLAGMAFGAPIGMGIGALMGQYGGKKGALQGALLGGLGGLGADYFNKAGTFSPGRFGDKFLGGFDEMVAGKLQQGTGLKGIAQNIGQAVMGGAGTVGEVVQTITGGDKAGIKGILGNDKIIALITGLLAKKGFDDQDMSKANINDYRSLIDEKYGSVTGGSPYAADRFRGLAYNPEDEKNYDYINNNGAYENFSIDDDGKVIDDMQISTGFNQGGIANLNMGGNPHRMSIKINQRPVLNRAYGGGTDPEIFDPSMSGGQMMNKIKDNPGITQYFPPKFGQINGPGGPKDDKIPAMLSDGEFVMTAKAVDNAGGPKAMYNLMNKLDPESSKGKGILN
tara:strand:- start:5666 stop:6739 length:1074 start_codon:yes stop_codon:yes gene_type:complete